LRTLETPDTKTTREFRERWSRRYCCCYYTM